MEKGSSSPSPSPGVEILERLRKGEISDEELKKHIGLQWEKRLQWGYKPTHQEQLHSNLDFIKSLKEMDMSGEIETFTNETYELPSKLMEFVFGTTLKESTCYFRDESMTLDEAEEAMYELYCERAQIKDGQSVLDIGCGYGGLVLYIAQKYKNCHVTGLTNSTAQANYIQMQSKTLQLSNVDVILADVTKYDNEINTFDRIMLIGMIEHIKNVEMFTKKLSTWMNKDSLLFVDHLCHKSFNFHFEAMDEDDWYSGFLFPKGCLSVFSSSTLLYFQGDVSVVDHWVLNGMHGARSAQEWQKKLEQNMETIRGILLEQQQPVAAAMEGGNEAEESEAAVNQVVTFLKTLCIGSYVTFSSNNGEEMMSAHFLFKKK